MLMPLLTIPFIWGTNRAQEQQTKMPIKRLTEVQWLHCLASARISTDGQFS
jgi:hypothetical protein